MKINRVLFGFLFALASCAAIVLHSPAPAQVPRSAFQTGIITGTGQQTPLYVAGMNTCTVTWGTAVGSPTMTWAGTGSSDGTTYNNINTGNGTTLSGIGYTAGNSTQFNLVAPPPRTSNGNSLTAANVGAPGWLALNVTAFTGTSLAYTLICTPAQPPPPVYSTASPLPVTTPTQQPVPTASPGNGIPANNLPVSAYSNCVVPAGATPNVTPGNGVVNQCDAHGNQLVVYPSAQPVNVQNSVAVTGVPTPIPWTALSPEPVAVQGAVPVTITPFPGLTPAPLPTSSSPVGPYLIANICAYGFIQSASSCATIGNNSGLRVEVSINSTPLPVTTPTVPQASSSPPPAGYLQTVGVPVVAQDGCTAGLNTNGNLTAGRIYPLTCIPLAAATTGYIAPAVGVCANGPSPSCLSITGGAASVLNCDATTQTQCGAVNANHEIAVQNTFLTGVGVGSLPPCSNGGLPITNSGTTSISGATAVQLFAVSGTTKYYICGYQAYMASSVQGAVLITTGTKTTNNCDTGAVNVIDQYMPTVSSNVTLGPFPYPIVVTAASKQLCLETTGTSTFWQVTVWVSQQ
jgi:hypothetical protein